MNHNFLNKITHPLFFRPTTNEIWINFSHELVAELILDDILPNAHDLECEADLQAVTDLIKKCGSEDPILICESNMVTCAVIVEVESEVF